MPAFWSSDPHRQMTVSLANKLCSSALSGSVDILSSVQTSGRHFDGTHKDFSLIVHKPALWLIPGRVYANEGRCWCITYTKFCLPVCADVHLAEVWRRKA